MKKKELQSLPVLNATPKIMAAARQNHLQKETVTYGKWQTTHEFYEYGLFIRCAIKNDILMVALYLPEHLCTGGKLPSYTLFISRSERCFITYDYLVKKWRTATLYNLDLGTRFYYSKKKWISQSDIQKIQTYLGEEGGYEGVLRFQNKIREEELERRYRKETDRWDADLTQVPQLPKDWERWVSKVGIQENYIFYRYQKGGAKTGYCTYCGKEVPISKPKYNKEGRCPRCRHHVTYKTVNKAGRVSTKTVTMYLIQRCRDGFVTRMFEGERFYRPGEYDRPLISYREIGRVIYDQNTGTARPFYWGVYKQRNTRWIAGSVREVTSYYWTYPNRSYVGRVYGKTIPSLTKKELLKTGLLEYFRYSATFDLDEYLGALKRAPKIEQLVKVGLFRLADECINDITSSDIFKHLEQTSLTKTLGISRQQLKLLRLKNSEKDTLRWMQYETEIRRTIPDDIVAFPSCGELPLSSINHGDLADGSYMIGSTIKAIYSEKGLIYWNSNFLFQQTKEPDLGNGIISVDAALKSLTAKYDLLLTSASYTITNIELVYLPVRTGHNAYELRPVWQFKLVEDNDEEQPQMYFVNIDATSGKEIR